MATRSIESQPRKIPAIQLTSESRERMSETEPHLGRINMWESDTHLVIVTPVPGAQPSDLSVRLNGSQLEVEGHARTPDPTMESQHVPSDRTPSGTQRRYFVREWLAGSFSRGVNLPLPVSHTGAEASLGNGVLVIALPKADSFPPGGPQSIQIVRRDF